VIEAAWIVLVDVMATPALMLIAADAWF